MELFYMLVFLYFILEANGGLGISEFLLSLLQSALVLSFESGGAKLLKPIFDNLWILRGRVGAISKFLPSLI
jgi:hypothetical protein